MQGAVLMDRKCRLSGHNIRGRGVERPAENRQMNGLPIIW